MTKLKINPLFSTQPCLSLLCCTLMCSPQPYKCHYEFKVNENAPKLDQAKTIEILRFSEGQTSFTKK